MKDKYAILIEQLERVTEAYESALIAVKALETTTGEQLDVLGVSGGVTWYGDKFEKDRAIQLGADTFTPFAIDCGSDFKMEGREDYTRFECSMFGYRVFARAQMLVDLELNGEFSVHQKDDTSKVICYQDLLVEFAEINPDLFCDALRSDKEQFEKAALQLAAKWRDFVIEQIDEHYAIEHVQNHAHNLRGH